jgi:hypothetical protein
MSCDNAQHAKQKAFASVHTSHPSCIANVSTFIRVYFITLSSLLPLSSSTYLHLRTGKIKKVSPDPGEKVSSWKSPPLLASVAWTVAAETLLKLYAKIQTNGCE